MASFMDNGLHYNDLTQEDKFRACDFLNEQLKYIEPRLYSAGYKHKLKNAFNLKRTYETIFPFGVLEDLPESIDFRNISNKDLIVCVAPYLYKLKNIERAAAIAPYINEEKESKKALKKLEELEDEIAELKWQLKNKTEQYDKQFDICIAISMEYGIDMFKQLEAYSKHKEAIEADRK